MTPATGYTQMKGSGAIWLGCIPADWGVSKIGSLYTQRNEKVSDKDYPPLSVTMRGIVPQLATAAKTDDGDNRKLVKIGDFAINSRSDRRGSCGISPYDGSVSLINTILTPRKAMHPGYYNWLFHTDLFADEFYKWGHGIVDDLWTTRWSEMKRIFVPVPPYETQEAIAAFLDSECAKIDEIIAEAKSSIEDYKQWKASVIHEAVTKGLDPDVEMKESGVEYIGKIPASWMLKKLRNLGAPQNGISKGAEFFGTGYPFVSYGDVYKNFSLPATPSGLINSTEIERDHYSVKEGDVFFTRTSETIEEVGFSCVCEKTIPDATFAGFLIRVRPYTDELLTGFAKYYFRSPHHRAYFAKEMNLVTRASLSQDLLKSMPVVVPPQNEQKEIADFLERKCSTVDALISEKQSLISDLEAYKKSLIYEVVTGKRRVPTQTETTVVAIHPAYQKALLMCRVLDLLGDDAKGRIHVQKCLFAIECLLKMPFQTQYARYQHGPYDTCIADYEALIGENDWFTVQSGSPVTYKKGAHFDAYLTEYMKVFSELDSKIKEIVEYLKPMKTAQAERVATLLAAWNDFILDGTADPTDQQIINEVITNWTPNKANTQVSTWQTTLDKLKNNGFVPTGFGVHTIQKEVQEV